MENIFDFDNVQAKKILELARNNKEKEKSKTLLKKVMLKIKKHVEAGKEKITLNSDETNDYVKERLEAKGFKVKNFIELPPHLDSNHVAYKLARHLNSSGFEVIIE